MQLVCPDMMDAGGGNIVNVTSVASRIAALPGYGGSKAALEHLTMCAAQDLKPHNIAVNALAPSRPIATPGLSYYRSQLPNTSPDDEFARAAVELAVIGPDLVTGRTIGHLQVLDGSFGRSATSSRRWPNRHPTRGGIAAATPDSRRHRPTCCASHRQYSEHSQRRRDDVDHRGLIGPEQVSEDPDRQRLQPSARR